MSVLGGVNQISLPPSTVISDIAATFIALLHRKHKMLQEIFSKMMSSDIKNR